MKYLLLLNNATEEWEAWRDLSAEDAQKAYQQELPHWNALFGWIAEQGIEANGLELDDPRKARVVRVRDGETLVTDGPFAETKEQLGGYYLVEAKDVDEALKIAERIPSARYGTIEVRPVVVWEE